MLPDHANRPERPTPGVFRGRVRLGYYRRDGALRSCRLTTGRIELRLGSDLSFDCGETRVTLQPSGPTTPKQIAHEIAVVRMTAEQRGRESQSITGAWQCYGPSLPNADNDDPLPATQTAPK